MTVCGLSRRSLARSWRSTNSERFSPTRSHGKPARMTRGSSTLEATLDEVSLLPRVEVLADFERQTDEPQQVIVSLSAEHNGWPGAQNQVALVEL